MYLDGYEEQVQGVGILPILAIGAGMAGIGAYLGRQIGKDEGEALAKAQAGQTPDNPVTALFRGAGTSMGSVLGIAAVGFLVYKFILK